MPGAAEVRVAASHEGTGAALRASAPSVRLGRRHALEMRDEVLGAAIDDACALGELGLRLLLPPLPLGRPEPSLVGIDRPFDDPAQKHARALDGAVRQFVDQLVKLSLRHEPNSRTNPGSSRDASRATGWCSRLDSREEGAALLLAEILNHHLIVRRERTSAAQQLLDRQLKVLFTVVRRVRRHASNMRLRG